MCTATQKYNNSKESQGMLALIYWQENPIIRKQNTHVNVNSCKALRIEYPHPLVEFLHSGVHALSNPHISSHRWMICKDNNLDTDLK